MGKFTLEWKKINIVLIHNKSYKQTVKITVFFSFTDLC